MPFSGMAFTSFKQGAYLALAPTPELMRFPANEVDVVA